MTTQAGTMKRPIVKLSPFPMYTYRRRYKPDKNENEKPNIKMIPSTSLTNKTKVRRCFLTLFTTLITMCTIISGSHAVAVPKTAKITNLESERPIYYDTMGNVQIIHDEWTLLMYYNLTNYWESVRRIEAFLFGIKDICEKLDRSYCKTTLGQLDHEMDLLNYYNTILVSPHKHLSDRKKRGLIDGVGYVANSLFGILDQRFADKYHNDIKAVQNNENYLLNLIKNQTTIMELQNNALKKFETNFNRQLNVMENFMKETNDNLQIVGSALDFLMASSYFNSASLTADLLLNNLKRVQEMLFDTLTDIYKGHMDVHLVTPVNLINQLNDIAGRLPRTLSLPVENVKEDIKDLYKLLYVKARVTDQYFLFEIHIPLITDEEFALYQAIPLPVKTNSGTVILTTTSKYIAANFKKNTYISLTEEILKQCVQQKPDSYICNKNLPIFNLNNNDVPCEAKLLGHHTTSSCDDIRSASCKDTWIELHTANTWLAICCDTCSLRTVCENEVSAHTMEASAIVTLPQGCVLQSKYLTIHSHNQYNSKVKINYNLDVPALNSSVNRMVNLTYQRTYLLRQENQEEEEKIEKYLESQRVNEIGLPSTLTTHDVHQYAISYSLLGMVVSLLIWWAVKRYFPQFCI